MKQNQADDKAYMDLALKLAVRARGRVEPNPMVGAVIVRDGQIVGKGHHRKFGGPHAEIEAIRNAGGESACVGATLYVTLEPCCHHGKTPPCTDAIIRSAFSRVVVAMKDPFSAVRGKGLRLLRQAGISVETGLLGNDAKELNAPYIKLRSRGLPYFIAKWAMSADGKIATKTGDSKWISSEPSRRLVHRIRSRVDAVMIGIGTALKDNPELTCRLASGRNPARIVVDSRAQLSLKSNLVKTARKTRVIVAVTSRAPAAKVKALEKQGCEILKCRSDKSGGVNLLALAKKLGNMEFTNVLVEGGASLFGSLFDRHLIDEVVVFIAPIVVGGNKAVPTVGGEGVRLIKAAASLCNLTFKKLGNDMMMRGRVTW